MINLISYIFLIVILILLCFKYYSLHEKIKILQYEKRELETKLQIKNAENIIKSFSHSGDLGNSNVHKQSIEAMNKEDSFVFGTVAGVGIAGIAIAETINTSIDSSPCDSSSYDSSSYGSSSYDSSSYGSSSCDSGSCDSGSCD